MDAFKLLTPEQQEHVLNGPSLAPPPGVQPNFIDPPNGTALCFGVVITSIALVTLGTVVRMYTRIFCIRKIRVEDFFMIAALGLYAGFTYIEMYLFVTPGGFVHQWDIRLKDTPPILKGVNIASIIYTFAILLLKAAIFLDWIHLFAPSNGHRGAFYYGCISSIVVNTLVNLAIALTLIFACVPRSKIWNLLEHGTCLNIYPCFVASSIFNFIMDVIMLTMPLRIIWKMQLRTRRKVAISALFVVGVFGCVCGALRIPYAFHLLLSADKFYYVTGSALAGSGEIAAGFLVLCVPSIPKMVKSTPWLVNLLSKVKSSMGYSSEKSKPNSRLGLPSWIRIQGQGSPGGRRQAQDTDCSEVDLYLPTSSESGHQLPHSASKEGEMAQSKEPNGFPQQILCTTEFITVHEV